MDELIIVSVDSHAQMPPEQWAEYLERRHHDLLPGLHDEQAVYAEVLGLVFDRAYAAPELFDREGAYRAGQWRGLHDLDVRLAEMDRESVAGEFVYSGDGRIIGLFFEAGNRVQDPEACRAGVRAHHRWLHDAMGSSDRLSFVGSCGSGPCLELDPVLTELDWIAAHGFHATDIPGKTTYRGDPPLHDPHWEPFWSRCEDLGLALWIHGGHGQEQASLSRELERAMAQYESVGRDPEQFWQILVTTVLNGELLDSPRPRQAMWQLMFSGVFDRHPDLTLMMNEVRGDWLPATLQHLDRVWHEHRDEVPALRPPSEYWVDNCVVGLSFVHKAEVEHRHDIALDTITFGRDYPHSEGTWPNTVDWLRDAFAGVPEPELRAILGENAITAFDLDRDGLAAAASRIGLRAEDVVGPHAVDDALVQHFGERGGYLKPFEGAGRLPELDVLLREDLPHLADY
jgi:predicted TIM-barrel fold metal-dependent hydrolase